MSNILQGLSFASMMAALYLVFIWVPTEREMGVVQRIFYFHVPLAWVSFLAFFVVFVSSILYLWKGERRWDSLAYASAEIGILFTTLVLITGPIWAKPVWGTWWVWDTRLTTTLVLWLIYLAYLMVRPFASDESQGARFAAVVGVVGFVDVPFVALAIVMRRTQHPGPLIFEGGLTSSMLITLLVCVAAFTILYVNVLVQRMSLREVEAEIAEMRQA